MARRLLSISHSYVVGLNRAVPNALARLGWEVTAVAPAAFPGDLRPIRLEHEGSEPARVVALDLRRPRFVHLMSWERRLRSVLNEPWDVVHVWEEPYVYAGAQIARWRRRGALVYSTFQNIPKRYPPPFSWFERYSLGRASGWIAFGRTIEAALARRRPYAHVPHRVIPPAVDLERFAVDADARRSVRDELRIAASEAVIGFIGRFVPEKGILHLAATLDAMRSPWRAVFIGTGRLESPLRQWAARHGDRVRILTDVTHSRVPRYLNALDILAAPSRTTRRWHEQFGRVLVEGMACGAAVVASDSGEIPHVVGEAGVLLPEADVNRWAETLDRLACSVEERRRLASAGQERAQQFSPASIARAHDEFFTTLIGARH